MLYLRIVEMREKKFIKILNGMNANCKELAKNIDLLERYLEKNIVESILSKSFAETQTELEKLKQHIDLATKYLSQLKGDIDRTNELRDYCSKTIQEATAAYNTNYVKLYFYRAIKEEGPYESITKEQLETIKTNLSTAAKYAEKVLTLDESVISLDNHCFILYFLDRYYNPEYPVEHKRIQDKILQFSKKTGIDVYVKAFDVILNDITIEKNLGLFLHTVQENFNSVTERIKALPEESKLKKYYNLLITNKVQYYYFKIYKEKTEEISALKKKIETNQELKIELENKIKELHYYRNYYVDSLMLFTNMQTLVSSMNRNKEFSTHSLTLLTEIFRKFHEMEVFFSSIYSVRGTEQSHLAIIKQNISKAIVNTLISLRALIDNKPIILKGESYTVDTIIAMYSNEIQELEQFVIKEESNIMVEVVPFKEADAYKYLIDLSETIDVPSEATSLAQTEIKEAPMQKISVAEIEQLIDFDPTKADRKSEDDLIKLLETSNNLIIALAVKREIAPIVNKDDVAALDSEIINIDECLAKLQPLKNELLNLLIDFIKDLHSKSSFYSSHYNLTDKQLETFQECIRDDRLSNDQKNRLKQIIEFYEQKATLNQAIDTDTLTSEQKKILHQALKKKSLNNEQKAAAAKAVKYADYVLTHITNIPVKVSVYKTPIDIAAPPVNVKTSDTAYLLKLMSNHYQFQGLTKELIDIINAIKEFNPQKNGVDLAIEYDLEVIKAAAINEDKERFNEIRRNLGSYLDNSKENIINYLKKSIDNIDPSKDSLSYLNLIDVITNLVISIDTRLSTTNSYSKVRLFNLFKLEQLIPTNFINKAVAGYQNTSALALRDLSNQLIKLSQDKSLRFEEKTEINSKILEVLEREEKILTMLKEKEAGFTWHPEELLVSSGVKGPHANVVDEVIATTIRNTRENRLKEIGQLIQNVRMSITSTYYNEATTSGKTIIDPAAAFSSLKLDQIETALTANAAAFDRLHTSKMQEISSGLFKNWPNYLSNPPSTPAEEEGRLSQFNGKIKKLAEYRGKLTQTSEEANTAVYTALSVQTRYYTHLAKRYFIKFLSGGNDGYFNPAAGFAYAALKNFNLDLTQFPAPEIDTIERILPNDVSLKERNAIGIEQFAFLVNIICDYFDLNGNKSLAEKFADQFGRTLNKEYSIDFYLEACTSIMEGISKDKSFKTNSIPFIIVHDDAIKYIEETKPENIINSSYYEAVVSLYIAMHYIEVFIATDPNKEEKELSQKATELLEVAINNISKIVLTKEAIRKIWKLHEDAHFYVDLMISSDLDKLDPLLDLRIKLIKQTLNLLPYLDLPVGELLEKKDFLEAKLNQTTVTDIVGLRTDLEKMRSIFKLEKDHIEDSASIQLANRSRKAIETFTEIWRILVKNAYESADNAIKSNINFINDTLEQLKKAKKEYQDILEAGKDINLSGLENTISSIETFSYIRLASQYNLLFEQNKRNEDFETAVKYAEMAAENVKSGKVALLGYHDSLSDNTGVTPRQYAYAIYILVENLVHKGIERPKAEAEVFKKYEFKSPFHTFNIRLEYQIEHSKECLDQKIYASFFKLYNSVTKYIVEKKILVQQIFPTYEKLINYQFARASIGQLKEQKVLNLETCLTLIDKTITALSVAVKVEMLAGVILTSEADKELKNNVFVDTLELQQLISKKIIELKNDKTKLNASKGLYLHLKTLIEIKLNCLSNFVTYNAKLITIEHDNGFTELLNTSDLITNAESELKKLNWAIEKGAWDKALKVAQNYSLQTAYTQAREADKRSIDQLAEFVGVPNSSSGRRQKNTPTPNPNPSKEEKLDPKLLEVRAINNSLQDINKWLDQVNKANNAQTTLSINQKNLDIIDKTLTILIEATSKSKELQDERLLERITKMADKLRSTLSSTESKIHSISNHYTSEKFKALKIKFDRDIDNKTAVKENSTVMLSQENKPVTVITNGSDAPTHISVKEITEGIRTVKPQIPKPVVKEEPKGQKAQIDFTNQKNFPPIEKVANNAGAASKKSKWTDRVTTKKIEVVEPTPKVEPVTEPKPKTPEPINEQVKEEVKAETVSVSLTPAVQTPAKPIDSWVAKIDVVASDFLSKLLNINKPQEEKIENVKVETKEQKRSIKAIFSQAEEYLAEGNFVAASGTYFGIIDEYSKPRYSFNAQTSVRSQVNTLDPYIAALAELGNANCKITELYAKGFELTAAELLSGIKAAGSYQNTAISRATHILNPANSNLKEESYFFASELNYSLTRLKELITKYAKQETYDNGIRKDEEIIKRHKKGCEQKIIEAYKVIDSTMNIVMNNIAALPGEYATLVEQLNKTTLLQAKEKAKREVESEFKPLIDLCKKEIEMIRKYIPTEQERKNMDELIKQCEQRNERWDNLLNEFKHVKKLEAKKNPSSNASELYI
jgi:hypothetical protein